MPPLLHAADFELRLDRGVDGHYVASTSLRLPESDAPSGVSGVPVQFDLAELRANQQDDAAYGRALAAVLFDSRRLSDALAAARSAAASHDLPLRLRLHLDPADDALQALRWELLCDLHGTHFGLSEQIRLSRFVVSPNTARYQPPTRRALRALVAAAAPANLAKLRLTPFDADAAVEAATAALRPAQVTILASGTGPVSLSRLAEALRDEPDLLCLVCHGALMDEPLLYLEGAQGQADPVTAKRLLEMLGSLGNLPRLLVLLACEGAGDGSYAAMTALGPRLAHAGVPAVVAMQGKIGMVAALDFLASMSRELQRDGQIDRAVAAARATVRTTTDWWRPALFMRLISGQLWVPDATEEPACYETVPSFPSPGDFPPVALTGSQAKLFSDALRDAFTLPRLRELLYYALHKHLDDISLGADFRQVVFDIIRTAEAEGWTFQLLRAAQESNPGNPMLQRFAQQYGASPSTPPRPEPE